jgi:hypothetical protein
MPVRLPSSAPMAAGGRFHGREPFRPLPHLVAMASLQCVLWGAQAALPAAWWWLSHSVGVPSLAPASSAAGGGGGGGGGGNSLLAAVLDARAVSAASADGWAHIAGVLAGAGALAWATAAVVGRLKKAVDFVASAYALHALACAAWAGALPDSPAWWLCNGVALIVAATLAEYLCLRREAREILLGGATPAAAAAPAPAAAAAAAPLRRGPGVASPPPPPPLAAAGATPALSAWAAAATARATGPAAAAALTLPALAADGEAALTTPPRSSRASSGGGADAFASHLAGGGGGARGGRLLTPAATSLYAASAPLRGIFGGAGGRGDSNVFRFAIDAERGDVNGSARAPPTPFSPFAPLRQDGVT